MYMWYFNGCFPPQRKEVGCQETEKKILQSPYFVHFYPSLMQKMKLQALSQHSSMPLISHAVPLPCNLYISYI